MVKMMFFFSSSFLLFVKIVCGDFDLCESCDARDIHKSSGHPLLKLVVANEK